LAVISRPGVEFEEVVEVVQPVTSKDADKSKRTIIAVIGFNCIRLCKRRNSGLTLSILHDTFHAVTQDVLQYSEIQAQKSKETEKRNNEGGDKE
jgi:hypothetical protein